MVHFKRFFYWIKICKTQLSPYFPRILYEEENIAEEDEEIPRSIPACILRILNRIKFNFKKRNWFWKRNWYRFWKNPEKNGEKARRNKRFKKGNWPYFPQPCWDRLNDRETSWRAEQNCFYSEFSERYQLILVMKTRREKND